MIQLPQLQESLLLANDRLVDRARRRARRATRSAGSGIAAASFASAAFEWAVGP